MTTSIGFDSLSTMSFTRPQSLQPHISLIWLVSMLTLGVLLPFALLAYSEVFDQVMPMNDVLLYGWWLQGMQQSEPIFGIGQPFVYPYLSLVPMWLAAFLGGPAGILVGWCTLIAILNVLVILAITNWGRGQRESFTALWFWLIFVTLLGPVAIARIDAIAVALALLGLAALVRKKLFLATALFTAGAWIKIWPFVLVLSSFLAEKSKRAVALSASLVVSAIVLIALALGAGPNLFSFISTQVGRGIQIEAPIALPWLWLAKLGIGDSAIYFDEEIITNQISGTGSTIVANLMTPIMFFALAITAILGVRAYLAGSDRTVIFSAVALTGVLDLIVFNKVGSPQFMAWLAVPVCAWIIFKLPKAKSLVTAVLALALLTGLIYPVFYIDFINLGEIGLVLVTIRNLLLIALLVWANIQLGNLAKKPIRNSAATESSELV
ncbi:unannotated protein [freshwater metagenome]|uniref:Unannotated protein n=1 Tax=freshwater metagenome TaxID=449393 RepID=A0A6J6D0R0_9ZZZZ